MTGVSGGDGPSPFVELIPPVEALLTSTANMVTAFLGLIHEQQCSRNGEKVSSTLIFKARILRSLLTGELDQGSTVEPVNVT